MKNISSQQWKWIVVLLIIIAIIITFVLTTAKNNIAYYVTPSEIYATPVKYNKRNLRVMGIVLPKSVIWDSKTLNLHFLISDSNKNITVDFQGIKPDMFKEGQGVIAVGNLDNYKVKATKLLVKHTAEYRTKHKDILKAVKTKINS